LYTGKGVISALLRGLLRGVRVFSEVLRRREKRAEEPRRDTQRRFKGQFDQKRLKVAKTVNIDLPNKTPPLNDLQDQKEASWA